MPSAKSTGYMVCRYPLKIKDALRAYIANYYPKIGYDVTFEKGYPNDFFIGGSTRLHNLCHAFLAGYHVRRDCLVEIQGIAARLSELTRDG